MRRRSRQWFGLPVVDLEELGELQNTSLTTLVDEQLRLAKRAPSGRSAQTVYGGHEHSLRQTVIALASGRRLDEHESPGEATVFVLHGHIRLEAGDESLNAGPGDLLTVPDTKHALQAEDDAVVLLTVAIGL